MKSGKVIAIKKITEEHLKDMCGLLGVTFISFESFPHMVKVCFEDESIETDNKCLIIDQDGKMFIAFYDIGRDNQAINTIPLVFYLKEHNLLLE
jgi:hypothetical protein